VKGKKGNNSLLCRNILNDEKDLCIDSHQVSIHSAFCDDISWRLVESCQGRSVDIDF